jgi:hypothetical protein
MRMLSSVIIATVAFIMLWDKAAAAANAVAAPLTAARAPHAMALDPSMRDPAWTLGCVQPDVYWNVTKRSTARLRAQSYLLYDDRILYVAFHAEQAGAPIVAGQRTNDVGFGVDDFVGVAIDASGAGNQVYFFETTPLRTRYQQSSDNVRYLVRWESVSEVTGNAWNAVLVIPLSALRIPTGANRHWRVDFIRSVASQSEHYTWAYNGLMTDGVVGQSWPAFGDARYSKPTAHSVRNPLARSASISRFRSRARSTRSAHSIRTFRTSKSISRRSCRKSSRANCKNIGRSSRKARIS